MARGQVLAEPQWPEIDLWSLLKEMDSNTKMRQNSNHEDTIHPFLPSPGLPYFEPDLSIFFRSQLVHSLPPPDITWAMSQGLTLAHAQMQNI